MANILKAGGLTLALVILVVVVISSPQAITVADARSPYDPARQLATDCNSPVARDIPGCDGRNGTPAGPVRPARPGRPSGPAPGSSGCRNGCCGKNKFGECMCC